MEKNWSCHLISYNPFKIVEVQYRFLVSQSVFVLLQNEKHFKMPLRLHYLHVDNVMTVLQVLLKVILRKYGGEMVLI